MFQWVREIWDLVSGKKHKRLVRRLQLKAARMNSGRRSALTLSSDYYPMGRVFLTREDLEREREEAREISKKWRGRH